MTNAKINATYHKDVLGKCVHEDITVIEAAPNFGVNTTEYYCKQCDQYIRSTRIPDHLNDPAAVLDELKELLKNYYRIRRGDMRQIIIEKIGFANAYNEMNYVVDMKMERAVLLAGFKRRGIKI